MGLTKLPKNFLLLTKYSNIKMYDIFQHLKRHGDGFSFPIVEHRPTLQSVEVHFEGRHIVYFKEGQHENAADKGKEKSTKLLA